MTIEPPELSDAAIKSLTRRLDRPVVLVGMMGVGKSTVGRKLSALLGTSFTDADDEIEQSAHMPITDIFEVFGEPYFRDGERRVIARILEAGPGVLATGGGAFVQPETRSLILERGIAVWLDSDVDTLVERTGRRDTRPLLRGGDPREIIARLKREREPAYSQAPIKVTSTAGPHQNAVLDILKALDAWL
ncbi:shikimate kinase [Altericroceibacterium xinjiangense]|uniref:shikimate kinase n=1 Tax=Altericroceibacterium xinjiangense TaxID=762261 RepID=UPI0019D04106|nr:shikimate kinase [Altericroceibacterium xinjiangense]